MVRILTFAFVLAAAPLAQAQPQGLGSLVQAELQSLESLYRHLHANPELSLREEATAARIAAELRASGFEVTAGVGGHGVVAVMRNGAGPTVMLRTDLDALPVEEKTGLDYASRVRTRDDQGNDVGVMHACAHDMHMTSFIGAARLLSKLRDRWSGTLVMIGQPAEELGSGALAMLADGLYTRFPRPDFCVALHVDAALEAGKVGYREGFVMANVDSVDLTVRGVGGHGAYPHTTKDPIVIAAQIVLALQTIVSREIRPIDAAVVSVGAIQGGNKHNIIPDQVTMQLTVRSYSDETRKQILEAIERIATNIARAAGVPDGRLPTIKLARKDYTPATYNDPELVKRLVPAWQSALGTQNVVLREPEMGAEDFSQYGRQDPRIPIVLFRLGTVQPERVAAAKTGGPPLPGLHSPEYAPAIHPTIETGAKAMAAAALELLGKR